MAELQIEALQKDDALVVRLSGEVGLSEEYTFRQQVSQAIQKQSVKVVVNLEGVTLLSSYGIAAVVNLWKQLQDREGRFCLVCPQNHVFDCLAIAGANRIIPIFQNEEQALEFCRSK
jgi:anti-anti-sigma factor